MNLSLLPNQDPQKAAYMAIVNAISKQAEGITLIGDSFSQFSLSLLDLINEAAPEYASIIEHVTNVYDEVVQLKYDHSKILKRVSEDIRDIYERSLVIQRLDREYKTAENNYTKARSDWIKNKGKNNEKQLKENAQICLQKVKDSLSNLIEQKKKMWKFTLRRVSHAVSFYTVALSKSSEKEANLMNQVVSIIESEAIQKIGQQDSTQS